MRKGGSKSKGGAFENKILREIRTVYPDAYKTIGSGNAADDKGDIVWKDYCIECKHHKDLTDGQIDRFWEKIAREAANMCKVPLLVYKINRRAPIVMFKTGGQRLMMRWKDFLLFEKEKVMNKR